MRSQDEAWPLQIEGQRTTEYLVSNGDNPPTERRQTDEAMRYEDMNEYEQDEEETERQRTLEYEDVRLECYVFSAACQCGDCDACHVGWCECRCHILNGWAGADAGERG